MKTIKINTFTFDELSEDAKETAIDNYEAFTEFIYDDAYNTVKEFNNVFNLNEGLDSWLDFSFNEDDPILELKGLRLRKYIINNYPELWTGKYYSLWSKTEKSYKYYKDGYPVLKYKHSKVTFEINCPFTGFCYDMDLLNPIIELLEYKKENRNTLKELTFEELIKDCFYSLKSSIESEVEYRYSNEGKREELENDDKIYTKDGNEFIL